MNVQDGKILLRTVIIAPIVLLCLSAILAMITALNTTNHFIGAEYLDAANWVVNLGDFILPLIFFILVAVSVALSVRIPTSNIYLIYTLLLLILMATVGAIFANVVLEFFANAALSAYAANFPITTAMLQNLPLIMVVVLMVDGIALYGKSSFSGVSG